MKLPSWGMLGTYLRRKIGSNEVHMDIPLTQEVVDRLVQELLEGKFRRNPFVRDPVADATYVAFDAIRIEPTTMTTLKITLEYEGKPITESSTLYAVPGGSTISIAGFEGALKTAIKAESY